MLHFFEMLRILTITIQPILAHGPIVNTALIICVNIRRVVETFKPCLCLTPFVAASASINACLISEQWSWSAKARAVLGKLRTCWAWLIANNDIP